MRPSPTSTACPTATARRLAARLPDVGDLRLHEAASDGDLASIRRLIAEGADLDARDGAGRTPVMAATVARQPRRSGSCLRPAPTSTSATTASTTRSCTPGPRASSTSCGSPTRLERTRRSRTGTAASPLIPASERGHVEVVRYLLDETDVDVDHVNNLGWTALLEAVILGDGGPAHQAIVRLLLDAGADPELADRDGVTPLAHARARGQAEVAAILVEAGARR